MHRNRLTLAGLALAALLAATRPAVAAPIPYTGAIQQYTVTQTGLYDFIVVGATGAGASGGQAGGAGAKATGQLALLAGTTLQLVVGGVGVSNFYFGGGGGGSFVYIDDATPLLIAGGGGGGGYDRPGTAASIDASGDAAAGTGPYAGQPGTQGSGGSTGGYTGFAGSGAGAGFYGDGASTTNAAGGHRADFSGGTSTHAPGGFGGGGAGAGSGGGGGGYSGGPGNTFDGAGYGGGGGGGSFAASEFTNVDFMQGFNLAGNGWIDIALVTEAAIPEPSTPALLLVAGLAVVIGRRRPWRRTAISA